MKVNRPYTGFTIVELLIVIVVIAILAAIVIVAYNGVTKQAIESGLEFDVKSAVTKVEASAVDNGGYPTTGSAGIASSGDNVLVYKRISDGYCIQGTNAALDQPVRYLSTVGAMENEECPTTIVVSSLTEGGNGYVDGAAAGARFQFPQGLAVAPDGRVFIAEYDGHRIRVLSADKTTVSTYVSGNNGSGYVDGASISTARLNSPDGIAVASDGRLFIADSNNHRIRVVSANGSTVSTYAGSGASGYGNGGYVDGNATSAARFNVPADVAIGPGGTLYVADSSNHRIRTITTGGTVATFAGIGAGYTDGNRTTEARFNQPAGVAVASDGTVYVADSGNHKLRKIAPNGVVSTLAGSSYGYTDATGTAAQFDGLHAIELSADEQTIYVGDWFNHAVRAVDVATGEVATIAGNGTYGYANGVGSDARFDQLGGIAIDANGNIFVSDRYNRMIRFIGIE